MNKNDFILLVGIFLLSQSLFSQNYELGLKVIPGISYESPLFQDYFPAIMGGIYYQRPLWKDVLYFESGGYFSNQRKYQYISFNPFFDPTIKVEGNIIYGSIPLILKINAASLFYYSFGVDMNFSLKENIAFPNQHISPPFIIGGIVTIGRRFEIYDGFKIDVEFRYNEFTIGVLNKQFINRFHTEFHHVGLGIGLIIG